MAPAKTTKVVQAIETFTGSFAEKVEDSEGNVTTTDVPFVVRKGETYDADHRIVQRHGQFFGPVRADSERRTVLSPEEVVF